MPPGNEIDSFPPLDNLGLYEFATDATELTETSPPSTLLLREKELRELPDGSWQRTYMLIDGSVNNVSSETGDFSQWEDTMAELAEE